MGILGLQVERVKHNQGIEEWAICHQTKLAAHSTRKLPALHSPHGPAHATPRICYQVAALEHVGNFLKQPPPFQPEAFIKIPKMSRADS